MFIKEQIKRKYKKYLFNKYSTYENPLILNSSSWCISPSKEQLIIKNNCDISGCRIYVIGNGKVSIGDHTTIRYNSKISSVCNISIGSHVIISNNVDIYDHNSHPTDFDTRWKMCDNGFYGEAWSSTKADFKPTIIEDGVWIGEKSTILKGVTIGRGSIVASHSVVTKSVPPYTIVAGNPAVVVKKLGDKEK